jgi:hypothetical protein
LIFRIFSRRPDTDLVEVQARCCWEAQRFVGDHHVCFVSVFILAGDQRKPLCHGLVWGWVRGAANLLRRTAQGGIRINGGLTRYAAHEILQINDTGDENRRCKRPSDNISIHRPASTYPFAIHQCTNGGSNRCTAYQVTGSIEGSWMYGKFEAFSKLGRRSGIANSVAGGSGDGV